MIERAQVTSANGYFNDSKEFTDLNAYQLSDGDFATFTLLHDEINDDVVKAGYDQIMQCGFSRLSATPSQMNIEVRKKPNVEQMKHLRTLFTVWDGDFYFDIKCDDVMKSGKNVDDFF